MSWGTACIHPMCFCCIEEARLQAEKEEQERSKRERRERELERLELKVGCPHGTVHHASHVQLVWYKFSCGVCSGCLSNSFHLLYVQFNTLWLKTRTGNTIIDNSYCSLHGIWIRERCSWVSSADRTVSAEKMNWTNSAAYWRKITPQQPNGKLMLWRGIRCVSLQCDFFGTFFF